MREPFTLTGPDFLDNLAHIEQNDDRLTNAAEYSKRADDWRNDLESARVARDANDLLSRELIKLRQQAAEAYDALSRVRPHSENLDDYTAARITLARIADFPLCEPAWITTAPTARDPRLQPMPGDRFYLPVEVTYANYGPPGEVATTLAPLLAGQRGDQTFHVYALQGAWLQGAIGIVPAAPLPIPAAAAA